MMCNETYLTDFFLYVSDFYCIVYPYVHVYYYNVNKKIPKMQYLVYIFYFENIDCYCLGVQGHGFL